MSNISGEGIRENMLKASCQIDRSFYFKGVDNKLNLRAQNLIVFLQLAEGIDNDTWKYHLDCREYSLWILKSIKDKDLSVQIAEIENLGEDKEISLEKIKTLIESNYTMPVKSLATRKEGSSNIESLQVL